MSPRCYGTVDGPVDWNPREMAFTPLVVLGAVDHDRLVQERVCQPVDGVLRARDHLPVERRGDHEEAVLVHRASLFSGQTHKVHGPYRSLFVWRPVR